MDYEKKYKDALERAKYYREGITDRKLENGENILDYIFPELKDSEDERTRKSIIELLNEVHFTFKYYDINKMLAWLEKQGKTSWKPSKEEMDVLYGLAYITNEFDERKEEVITQLYQDLKREFFNGASFENMFPTNTSAEFEKQGGNKHKFIIGDIISNNNITYRVDNIVKNCIGQDCYFLVDIESENNGTRYLKLIDSKGKNHNIGETTWLCEQVDAKFEKQGKQKPTKNIMNVWKDMRLEVYQQASGNRHEPNYSDDTTKMFSLNDIDEIIEKMGEQEPTDKVEIKQKPDIEKGKWYVCNTARYTDFVVGKAYYCPKNGMLKPDENEMARYVARNCFRLWTIQDAKDGDVLAIGNDYFLFKEKKENTLPVVYISHCFANSAGAFRVTNGRDCGEFHSIENGIKACPATKEQRYFLFQKMKEAGYEWDAENKVLKKIEQKPAWSEEDEDMFRSIRSYLNEFGNWLSGENEEKSLSVYKACDWLKSLKERMKGK